MPTSEIINQFDSISKELKVDADGKGYVSLRGLARLCGVKYQSWGQGDSVITHSIDRMLAQSGTDFSEVRVCNKSSAIPDTVAALVITYYAQAGNEIAQTNLMSFAAIGLRTVIQKATGYKPDPKRRLTPEEIIEICCLPVPTTWERRFPEEYYDHLSRLTGLIQEGASRPGWWASLTKELIYDYLPAGIYTQIKQCQKESGDWKRIHQYLSADGIQMLQTHQKKVLYLMQGAANLEQLRVSLKQSCTGQYQLVLL